MASKRKMNGCKSVKCVVDAINKIGCEIQAFFERVPQVVDAPPGFNPTKEAIRFNLFRNDGVHVHPDYEIPACVLEFAEIIHTADCPRKFYQDLQSRARVHARRMASELMSTYGAPPTRMRQAPNYA